MLPIRTLLNFASFVLDLTFPALFNVAGKVGKYLITLFSKHSALTTIVLYCEQTAVVTGGASGIGAMIASAFVQNGATVYIASRKEKQLKEVCSIVST